MGLSCNFFHLPVAGFCKCSIVGILWQEHFRQKKINHVRERQSDISYLWRKSEELCWMVASPSGEGYGRMKASLPKKIGGETVLATTRAMALDVMWWMLLVTWLQWQRFPSEIGLRLLFFFVIFKSQKLGKPMFMGIFHGINCQDLQWWVKRSTIWLFNIAMV